MKKLGIVMGIALAALTLVFSVNPATTDAKAKYDTAKTAGKKMYNLQKKLYKSKKKETVVLRFKVKSYYGGWNLIDKADNYTAKLELGKAYIPKSPNTPPATGWNYEECNVVYNYNKKAKTATFKITLDGKNKYFRKNYRDNECCKKLVTELQSFTNGKNQFDKAWITMVWLCNRASYWGGKNQRTSEYDLYKRHFKTDCDGLAYCYAEYAIYAGVKQVGVVEYDNHMWNWIKVDGKRYYIDFQCSRSACEWNKDIKKAIKIGCDPLLNGRWNDLWDLTDWYQENVDANAKPLNNCKAVWDKMTKEQKKAYKKDRPHLSASERFNYSLKCSSYSQANFLPANAFCEELGGTGSPEYWKHKVCTI